MTFQQAMKRGDFLFTVYHGIFHNLKIRCCQPDIECKYLKIISPTEIFFNKWLLLHPFLYTAFNN